MDTRTIGNRIATARKKVNLSQAQLAQHVFVSPQAVGKWERGESIPDIITLNRLAEILGVDLNYFAEGTGPATAEMTPAGFPEKQATESDSYRIPTGKQENKLNWDMSRGNWVDADFSGLKNLHEKFSSSNMKNCKFIGSDLSGLLLGSNSAEGCDFSGSDISSSRIQNSNLVNNLYKDCSLRDAEFSASHIGGCDFSGADFTGATIRMSAFLKNTMANAVLNRTSFKATAISGIVFEGTVEDCYFENCAFSKVTFQNSRLLNTFFKGRSLKRIRFIDCQADRMTYEFLKNGKADLTGITLIAS